MDSLARGGANIQELNTFRKALSQTKGGKLARDAYPSKVYIHIARIQRIVINII